MSDARNVYEDIIDREHHVSKKRKPMSRLNRAAQFSPFAALTGYDDLIREAERETVKHVDLDADRIAALDQKLAWLFRQAEPPEAAFTVFVPDQKKAGGQYVTVTGRVLKYDAITQSIVLNDGRRLAVEDIAEIECGGFEPLMW